MLYFIDNVKLSLPKFLQNNISHDPAHTLCIIYIYNLYPGHMCFVIIVTVKAVAYMITF